MQIKSGDYLILNLVLGKKVLARCNSVSPDGKRYRAVLETAGDKEEPPVEFKAKEVVANLGHSPKAGAAYGVKIEPMRERAENPFWGAIHIHHDLNDQHRKILKKVMTDVQGKLKQMHIPKLALQTEIRTQVGKMAGQYKYRPKADADVLVVKIDEDLSDLDYRFAHEYAHGIWFRQYTPKMKMAWVNLYQSAVQISDYSDKDLKQLLQDIKSHGDIRGFAKENPDDLPVLKAIFRHIKQTYSLDRMHFEMAMMLGEDIDKYWPTSIELGEKEVLLTKYAQKSPEELHSEAFALHFVGKKLPKKVSELLDKCLSRMKK